MKSDLPWFISCWNPPSWVPEIGEKLLWKYDEKSPTSFSFHDPNFLLIADVRTDACLPGEVQGGAGGGEEEVGGGGGQAEQQEGEPQGLRGGETGASTGKPFLNKLCHVNQSRFAQSTL